jgi:hypothetical protein
MASAPNMLSGSGCWRMRSTEIYSTATERLFLLNAHNFILNQINVIIYSYQRSMKKYLPRVF